MENQPHDWLAEKVQALSDIELALLLCLVADQHCIITADSEDLSDVREELKLVGSLWFYDDNGMLIELDCNECVWPHVGGSRVQ